jgi:hypothetical protein
VRCARVAALVTIASVLLAAPFAVEMQSAGSARPYRIGVLHPAFGERTPAVMGLRSGLTAAGLEEGRDR